MNEKNYPTIHANVSLMATGGRVSFGYEGADDLSKKHIESDGNINCAKPEDLGKGPVGLEFHLLTPKVTLDGIDYDLKFEGSESVRIKEKKDRGSFFAYLLNCLLEVFQKKQGQFGGYTNPGGNPHKLKFTNQNNDGKCYKYTLRAKAQAESGGAVLWLDDDPMIQNGGGHVGL